MIRIQVPPRELARLENLFQTTPDTKLRHRLQIVLMAHRRRRRHEIATDLGIHRRTVTRWLNAYCDSGLKGLQPRNPPRKTANIPDTLADTIRQWVIDGPTACGLDRANWTHAELADHLRTTHGITTSRSAMQRFCQKVGVRVYRPTYRYLRGDSAQQEIAQQEIAGLKKKRRLAK